MRRYKRCYSDTHKGSSPERCVSGVLRGHGIMLPQQRARPALQQVAFPLAEQSSTRRPLPSSGIAYRQTTRHAFPHITPHRAVPQSQCSGRYESVFSPTDLLNEALQNVGCPELASVLARQGQRDGVEKAIFKHFEDTWSVFFNLGSNLI